METSSARGGVEAALAMSPQTALPVNHAVALAQLGDFDRSEALAESAAKLFPSDTYLNAVRVPRNRAVIEIERGNPARASQRTMVCSQLFPFAASTWRCMPAASPSRKATQ